MEQVISATAEVGPDHVLTVSFPTDLPPGPVNVTVRVESQAPDERIRTFGDLLDSGLLGMWTDRPDLPRTNEELAKWRRKLWSVEPL